MVMYETWQLRHVIALAVILTGCRVFEEDLKKLPLSNFTQFSVVVTETTLSLKLGQSRNHQMFILF
jgi:hypothetical protein